LSPQKRSSKCTTGDLASNRDSGPLAENVSICGEPGPGVAATRDDRVRALLIVIRVASVVKIARIRIEASYVMIGG
jgi:hypothetical protein